MNTAGCFMMVPNKIQDQRGGFVKIFQKSLYDSHGLNCDFTECYNSFSYSGVVRGMHFQVPPHEHAKLVRCISGEVLDVIVDIRKGSPTYMSWEATELNSDSCNMIYLPAGVAHGFFSVTDALMEYFVTSEYSFEHDSGICWNSINFDWPNRSPIISARDQSFPRLDEFDSPFIYSSN